MVEQSNTLKIVVTSDSAHGWAKVPLATLCELDLLDKITPYSYILGDYAYLEEDDDMPKLITALISRGLTYRIVNRQVGRSSIRNYASYDANTVKLYNNLVLGAKLMKYSAETGLYSVPLTVVGFQGTAVILENQDGAKMVCAAITAGHMLRTLN